MSVNVVKARWKFSTEIIFDGELIRVCAEKGEELSLEPALLAIVNQDTGGVFSKPKTAKGATKAAETRQVVKTEKRTVKE